MERSEPTLVPQWLRSTGSVTGGGNSAHHFASSSHSDISLAPHARNRTSKTLSEFETPRSAFLDRSSSSNSRRSSSNGSAKHAYSSFNRSHRDKDREKDKDRFGDHWDRDSSDPLGNIFIGRVEKDTLRRSQSMVSRKQGELLSRRASVDVKSSSNSNHSNGNGTLSGSVGASIQKAVFEKDFPSLGTEERQAGPDVGRVSSPGFTTAVQSLPVANPALVGGEGWTSALVEPPVKGSSSSGSLSVQPTVAAATSGSGTSTTMAGLNMAEALAQAPSRTRAAPQLSVKTQRLEELAIKQSRQLIPVTPSMPKASVLSSEKSKPKTGARSGEMNVATKSGQQQQSSLHNVNQYLRGGAMKSDTPKTSHGKFLVLKPVWENGVSPSSKDVTSPTNNSTNKALNTQVAVAPPVVSAPSRSPNSQKVTSLERKVAALDLKSGPTLEKKPSLSQVQSRNDFFNLIKKKTSVNPSTVIPVSVPNISSPTSEKSGEETREAFSGPASPHTVENGAEVNGNGDSCKEIQRYSDVGDDECSSAAVCVDDEEEAKFLRSLGWEENAGEDEGLTEEEINAFYEEPKLSMLSESHATNPGGASSELSSSDSGSDA
ncbi:C-jun-amino-terminal kinase-interacting protein [Parasponia andersonii]|uniref:C-jun-amino-terminal kinase-interacting protein n=1 Tax=Parasponia andersonii TaxID=3476 RepID=A0A2P5DTJ9_PARAD|nr:C-jun-amino-terminal kinase-interacting protein [Parasponia andersonii]